MMTKLKRGIASCQFHDLRKEQQKGDYKNFTNKEFARYVWVFKYYLMKQPTVSTHIESHSKYIFRYICSEYFLNISNFKLFYRIVIVPMYVYVSEGLNNSSY